MVWVVYLTPNWTATYLGDRCDGLTQRTLAFPEASEDIRNTPLADSGNLHLLHRSLTLGTLHCDILP